jgi:hypothetical protein
VDAAVAQVLANVTDASKPVKPPISSTQKEQQMFMKKLILPAAEMRRILPYLFTVPYSIDAGVSVSIDQLYNMPDTSGVFSSDSVVYKVIYSIVPPGLYYKDPPLSEAVRFTRTNDLDKPARAPTFSDGFSDFYPPQMEENVFLLIDVRTVKIELPKKDSDPVVTVEPPMARKSWWSLLPLAKEKTRGQGFKYTASGIFQVPLIEGAIPAGLKQKLVTHITHICIHTHTHTHIYIYIYTHTHTHTHTINSINQSNHINSHMTQPRSSMLQSHP